MTAIAIIRQASAIHVLTDGLAVGADIFMRQSKATVVPHLDAVIAMRGTVGATTLVSWLSAYSSDFDDMVVRLPILARLFAESQRHLWDSPSRGISGRDLRWSWRVARRFTGFKRLSCHRTMNQAAHGSSRSLSANSPP